MSGPGMFNLFLRRVPFDNEFASMALHRDIFWVGRQWAVTGHGLQAVDQKQKSKFDIGISRLWEHDLTDGLSAERWFNAEDFSKGLSIARARYPEPGETGNAESPQPIEPEPEPTLECAPFHEPLARPREIAPVAPPQPVPKADLPNSGAAPAPPFRDTWGSLAELAKTAASEPLSKIPAPRPVAPPSPGVFAAPVKPPPRFDWPKPASPMIEPQRACLPFDMRIEGSGAKFCRMWRVRIHR
jgi:hypothetical protein